MKRFLKSTLAASLSFSLIGASLALAQVPGPQSGNHGPAPKHNNIHHTTVQHTIVQHQTIQHVVVQNHVTVQHVTVQHTAILHPPMQGPGGWNHSVPPQHVGFNGSHHWHSGDHFYGNRNYVTNYGQYHLAPPPSGYQWVQDSGQFVLIAVATGVITNVILNAAMQ